MTRPRRTLRVGGIPVGMDLSWVAISVLVVAAIGARVSWDGTSVITAMAIGVTGAVILVASVLGHEVAHAVMARRRGIPVRGVTLFVFGGYTEMGVEPVDHRDELAVALAGPVVSWVFAAGLWLGSLGAGGGSLGGVLGLMAVVNLAIGAFNLLPGLPLDGGRVVRAMVWRATGDPQRATRAATRSGVVVGSIVAAVGIGLLVVGRWPVAAWNVAVGWFLAQSAVAAGRSVGPGGSPVSVAMGPPGSPVGEDDVVGEPPSAPVPVIAAGRVVGVILPGSIPGPAREIMIRLERGDVVDGDAPIGGVLRRAARSGRPVVVVRDGRMVGVVSADRIRAFLEEDGRAHGR